MQVKGLITKNIQLFVQEKGQAEYLSWFNGLSPEAQKIFQSEILVSNWYPFEFACAQPLQKICDLFYGGDYRGGAEFGSFGIGRSLKGIYSVFIKLGSPQFIIKKASSIFSAYFNPIKIEVIESGKKTNILHITEFPEMSHLIERYLEGAIKKALEISGSKNVRTNITKSLASKDQYTEYQISWD